MTARGRQAVTARRPRREAGGEGRQTARPALTTHGPLGAGAHEGKVTGS